MSNAFEFASPGIPGASSQAGSSFPYGETEAVTGVQSTTQFDGIGEAAPETKAGGGWLLWIVVLLVVLAAAGGAALLLNRRRQERLRQRGRNYDGGSEKPMDATMPRRPRPGTGGMRRGASSGAHLRSFAVNRPNPAPNQMLREETPQVKAAPLREERDEGSVRTEVVEDDETNESRYCVGYAQTIGKRENQEDSYCFSSLDPKEIACRGLLAAVADGIGGMNDGEVASNAAMHSMCNLFPRQDPTQGPANRLLELAGKAQEDVLKINQQGNRCGCTLVSVLIHDGSMVMLSVGDSRIALYRSGILLQLNREHVLGKESDEEQTLKGGGAVAESSRRKAITAYLGKENLRTIDRTLTPMRLLPGDRVLLMSDGVFGALSDDEIIARLALSPEQAAREIIRAVDGKNLLHQDNATVLIVGVN